MNGDDWRAPPHRVEIESRRDVAGTGSVFGFRCSCGDWALQVHVPDVVVKMANLAAEPAVRAVFEGGVEFGEHRREAMKRKPEVKV